MKRKPENLTHKILRAHLLEGRIETVGEIAIRIDQTLLQDATSMKAWLQFEAIGVPRVRTQRSVSYIDHNTLQTGFENTDDHRFLQSAAAKFGAWFSRPGNGICHQVHLERFAMPGKTLLGSDSHTSTCGGIGMLAIGAGGLDVAVAMAGGPFHLATPRVLNVRLTGRLRPWVAAKDVILEILRRLTVSGGVGCVLEYTGPGVAALNVTQRATITNMGAELGATTSIFPSDERTRTFLELQRRAKDWKPLAADPDAEYDDTFALNLGALEPLIALPHSPDNVRPAREAAGASVQQVCIGSCTNSSVEDLLITAAILRGRHVHPGVSLVISPGSRQALETIVRAGAFADLLAAGARILENTCGPCIGMGQAPPSGGVSLRTFNRNFLGRCGTADSGVYLCSPQVAAATAVTGRITDPRELGRVPRVIAPKTFAVDDSMLIAPPRDGSRVTIVRGPNIKPPPRRGPMENTLRGRVLLRVGDNITTDHILPAGLKILPLCSNIPDVAKHVFAAVDPTFAERALKEGGGFIVGGANYGQGSSREHAALAPMYLGVRAVFAFSFARIHKANLVNFGISPLAFASPKDAAAVRDGDEIEIPDARRQIADPGRALTARNVTRGGMFRLTHDLSARAVRILLDGGLLNHTRRAAKKNGKKK